MYWKSYPSFSITSKRSFSNLVFDVITFQKPTRSRLDKKEVGGRVMSCKKWCFIACLWCFHHLFHGIFTSYAWSAFYQKLHGLTYRLKRNLKWKLLLGCSALHEAFISKVLNWLKFVILTWSKPFRSYLSWYMTDCTVISDTHMDWRLYSSLIAQSSEFHICYMNTLMAQRWTVNYFQF